MRARAAIGWTPLVRDLRPLPDRGQRRSVVSPTVQVPARLGLGLWMGVGVVSGVRVIVQVFDPGGPGGLSGGVTIVGGWGWCRCLVVWGCLNGLGLARVLVGGCGLVVGLGSVRGCGCITRPRRGCLTLHAKRWRR